MQKDYWAFVHEMTQGDCVLVIAHHFPLALATVAGDYNYIRNVDRKIGVWFRHFRAVENVRYYADFKNKCACLGQNSNDGHDLSASRQGFDFSSTH